ncbi:hypothetical protein CAEBREN_02214 [Caenorhabditis brenneri]|uniref:Uncharacterized protein n=1 Tax=Caenorhabditis brenneri TaxID=135651 RepID=G0MBC7_CAEBE|nr:hypothetical protein CAEBREN_02214 [Caenorhabditis brenneri]
MYSFSKRTKRAPIAVIDLTGDENLAPAQRPSNPVLSARSNPVPTEENRYNPYQRGSMKVDLSSSLNVPPKPLAENHWPSQYNQYNTMDWNEYFKRNQTLGMEQHFGMNTNFGSPQMASPHFPPNSWTGQSSSSQPLPPYVYDQINAVSDDGS